ncbi:protein of unknown function [Cupriavidus taiwanensis]|nr:protein of unknown function [Cupriavidus taiwanensis]
MMLLNQTSVHVTGPPRSCAASGRPGDRTGVAINYDCMSRSLDAQDFCRMLVSARSTF